MKIELAIDGKPVIAEEYLTVKEAAKFLGKPKIWVYRRIIEGKIEAVEVAGLIMVKKSRLEVIITKQNLREATMKSNTDSSSIFDIKLSKAAYFTE